MHGRVAFLEGWGLGVCECVPCRQAVFAAVCTHLQCLVDRSLQLCTELLYVCVEAGGEASCTLIGGTLHHAPRLRHLTLDLLWLMGGWVCGEGGGQVSAGITGGSCTSVINQICMHMTHLGAWLAPR